MYIERIIWLEDVVDKLESKHGVQQDEVRMCCSVGQSSSGWDGVNGADRMFITHWVRQNMGDT